MSLKPKDVFRIVTDDNLSEDAVSSLMMLYLPIIGKDAVLLYLLLHSEGRLARTQEVHSRLFDFLSLNGDDLERARIRLEECLLLRTYVQKGESRDSYLYHLNAPLPTGSFLASRDFLAMYIRAIGQKHADNSVSKLTASLIDTTGYDDITSTVRRLPSERDYDAAVSFQKVTPKYAFSKDDININFDYDHFFSTTSDLVFPNLLRTRENLELIGKLATLYGLSADKMRSLVGHAVTLDPARLDEAKLRSSCARAVPDITTAKDLYSLPPVSFLMAKQNGAMVTAADKKILERLKFQMHFSDEVINIMIEYILNRSDNRLNAGFVEMVAGEWARDGVKTREDALKETKKKTGTSAKKKQDVLPAYYNPDPERKSDGEKMSEAELEEMRKLLKKSGKEKH